jgi:hypothetical protein
MPRTHAALIVDSDPKGLESLVYGFQGAGWRITACPAPETASLLVKAARAEVVVAASRTDHDKVHALIKQLRGREAFRSLPVLVLGPEELRLHVKQHGQTDLLPLPTFVRDVLSASQMLVASEGSDSAPHGDQPILADATTAQGSLSLVRTMNGLRKSGSLHLARKGRHGEILFHEGELTGAQVGSLQGMAAVQHLLVWNDGHFELRLRPVVRRGQFHRTAHEFLEEFDRFQRDYSHAIKDIGPGTAVYLVNHDRLHASTGAIPAEVTPVIRLCDGQRSLADVIDESPFRVLDTTRILGRLIELAVLSRRDAVADSTDHEVSPLDAFWASARITLGGAAQDGARLSQPMQAQVEDPSMQKTPSPGLAPKQRTRRQTQELGKPSAAAAREAQPAPVVIPTGRPQIETQPIALRSDAASAKAVEAARRSTPAFGVGVTRGRASPARGVPVIKSADAASSQTSGSFELRKPRTTPTGSRPVEARRSVVIDTALVEVVAAGPVGSAPVSPAAPTDTARAVSSAELPQVSAPVPQTEPAQAPELPSGDASVSAESPAPPSATETADQSGSPEPAPPASPSQEAAPTASGPAALAPVATGAGHVHDEMKAAPARPAGQASQPAVSVELRGLPTDEPKTPAIAVPLAELKKETPGTRITGEMRVVSSGKSRLPVKVGATSSFHIDPTLTTDLPVAKQAPPPESDPRPQPNQGVHRPSGSFSAIESDFFEREADLYKVDKTESFADLDEQKGKGAGKARPTGGSSKRK